MSRIHTQPAATCGAFYHQFREHNQGRHALGHHQPPAASETCQRVVPCPARDIGHRCQALRRDPRPVRLRAPTPTARPLDHLQPRNPNTLRAVQVDAHFAVSVQIRSLRATYGIRREQWPDQMSGGRRWSASRLHRPRNRPCLIGHGSDTNHSIVRSGVSRAAKILILLLDLVAGVGFEPTTFRL
jgi:hypothetical protein